MNKKVFVAEIKWIKKEDGGRNLSIPMNYKKYCPQISIDGKYLIAGSAWGVYCYNYEINDDNTTKAYLKYLNQNDAPDVIEIGKKFELFEGPKKVAAGRIIDYGCNDIWEK